MKQILDLSYISETAPDRNGWKQAHKRAVLNAMSGVGHPYPILHAISAWCDYARTHARRFDSDIGEDYVLGPAWRDWGYALRTLLNGECGPNVDCGTLDHILVENLSRQGYDV